mmetsp:Transcript_41069/g.95967  ORF Transcript_41069/g.95967 Transcript_41069/m.95967 type:complete len:225 (+) Transcript_41069:584-1258(+)
MSRTARGWHSRRVGDTHDLRLKRRASSSVPLRGVGDKVVPQHTMLKVASEKQVSLLENAGEIGKGDQPIAVRVGHSHQHRRVVLAQLEIVLCQLSSDLLSSHKGVLGGVERSKQFLVVVRQLDVRLPFRMQPLDQRLPLFLLPVVVHTTLTLAVTVSGAAAFGDTATFLFLAFLSDKVDEFVVDAAAKNVGLNAVKKVAVPDHATVLRVRLVYESRRLSLLQRA